MLSVGDSKTFIHKDKIHILVVEDLHTTRTARLGTLGIEYYGLAYESEITWTKSLDSLVTDIRVKMQEIDNRPKYGYNG